MTDMTAVRPRIVRFISAVSDEISSRIFLPIMASFQVDVAGYSRVKAPRLPGATEVIRG